jgi:hypothetical protein
MLVPGYNCERPTQKNYDGFVTEFTRGLEDLQIDGLSLMLYGSYLRPQDFVAGRSDIDAVLIFPDNVVIDKTNFHRASIVLANALEGNNISFQVGVCDLSTLRDGRFNTYDPSFDGYFDNEAQIFGTDYRNQMKFILPDMPQQCSVSTNLRKTRNGLLFAQHCLRSGKTGYEEFLGRFNKSLQAISRSSKQVVSFVTGEFGNYRFSGVDEIREYFPDVNLDPLLEIKRLYENLDELDALCKSPDEVFHLWNKATTFMEKLIKAYMEKVPNSDAA